MGKGAKQQPRKARDSDEEVEDVMAWGRSRANYYQNSDDEYSSAS
jgi:hypothetical protein